MLEVPPKTIHNSSMLINYNKGWTYEYTDEDGNRFYRMWDRQNKQLHVLGTKYANLHVITSYQTPLKWFQAYRENDFFPKWLKIEIFQV